MIEGNSQIFVPGMAFVPEAPTISEALSSFGRRNSKTEKNVKKNLKDVQNSILSLLRCLATSYLRIHLPECIWEVVTLVS